MNSGLFFPFMERYTHKPALWLKGFCRVENGSAEEISFLLEIESWLSTIIRNSNKFGIDFDPISS